MKTHPIQIYLIYYLINPQAPRNEKIKRIRCKTSYIQILNALYQMNKNTLGIKAKWEEVAPGKKRIADVARTTRKYVTQFINSSEFPLFCEKVIRPGATHIYRLQQWVVDAFKFFEVKGMMKSFIDDFDSWKTTFTKRMQKWLLPLIDKGHSLKEILMNKLSTKSKLKGTPPDPLKGTPIKHPSVGRMGSSYEAPSDDIETKSGLSRILCLKDLDKAAETLLDRFKIKEADVNWIINHLGLKIVKGAIRIRESMMNFTPKSPIKGFMWCVSKYKQREYAGNA